MENLSLDQTIAIQSAITVLAACGPGMLLYLGIKIARLPIETEEN